MLVQPVHRIDPLQKYLDELSELEGAVVVWLLGFIEA